MLHLPNHILNTLIVRVDDDIAGTWREMQPVIIHFAFVAASVMALFECFFRAGQRKADHIIIFGCDPIQDVFADLRIRQHHRRKEHIPKIRIQIIGEDKGHTFIPVAEPCIRDGKRMHAPAPISVQIRAVIVAFKETRAHDRFAHSGGTADDDQLFIHTYLSVTASFSLHPFQ